ncbi:MULTISPECIES: 16S rRNA (cytosine(1402)-N(4))-methyltransferase RsmH [Halobacteriovorax]|uniref:Ribosomal RNA small subunit methyltransferase H n=1 Tax=Halobacteriovorax vibrionivorans TaxID=2152716 RepID=A0ABY0IJI3_9BACT|nr:MULTISPECIES: 16S rRNA (cytosine(1402)-N(4))-methyltransferase RsmH [Halobacteriovorax]RZF23129.1 16S rRNA (cytosine(1402)-N(4))-methyltransferase RsmH [Halobacteriovorax vibrionivorans]TGD49239.1 16S rRNA (cytosine(1402)-N(4))-methyltransferase RsmH [Halobacteriovorax sp. Y22]
MEDYKEHYSVLKNECLDYLYLNNEDKESLVFADCTFGAGGHSMAIVERNPNAKLISFDQDPDALANGRKLIEKNGVQDRLFLHDSNFVHFHDVVTGNHQELLDENEGLDGVLLDLGVSSHHFDEGSRGFSFRVDAPLDMRMDYDNDEIETAKDIINKYSKQELADLFREYGEEKFAWRIAEKIEAKREKEGPIETTFQLAELIKDCYPKKLQFGRIHPATKCFQALRIQVNKELDVVSDVIAQVLPLLKINGRILIISFHSLEDRIVKRLFKEFEKNGLGEMLFENEVKKPIIPSEEEISENPRSRSAKLRILKRVSEKKSKNKYEKFSKIQN